MRGWGTGQGVTNLADWSGREQMSVWGLQGLRSLLLLILGLEKGFWMENQGLFAAGPFALRPPVPRPGKQHFLAELLEVFELVSLP